MLYEKFSIKFYSNCFIGFATRQSTEIREYYKDIKSHTEYATDDSESYYSDQIVRNNKNLQWRALGIYQDTISFWYKDLHEASQQENNKSQDSAWALVMVTSSTQMSVVEHYQEWLFKDGKLIFHFDKMTGYDEESSWEYRYYFNNNKLIRTLSGNQIIDFEENTKKYLIKQMKY